jgi:hypothetical protein
VSPSGGPTRFGRPSPPRTSSSTPLHARARCRSSFLPFGLRPQRAARRFAGRARFCAMRASAEPGTGAFSRSHPPTSSAVFGKDAGALADRALRRDPPPASVEEHGLFPPPLVAEIPRRHMGVERLERSRHLRRRVQGGARRARPAPGHFGWSVARRAPKENRPLAAPTGPLFAVSRPIVGCGSSADEPGADVLEAVVPIPRRPASLSSL